MNANIIDSQYVDGSGGCRNLFFRPKGTEVWVKGEEYPYIQTHDQWIIQWEGAPDYDSGYAEYSYPSLEAAETDFYKGE